MDLKYDRFLKKVDNGTEVIRNFSTDPNFKIYKPILDNHDFTLEILKENLKKVEEYVNCYEDIELNNTVITSLYISAINIYALKEVLEKIQVSIYCRYKNCALSNNKLNKKRRKTIEDMEKEFDTINITKLEDRKFESKGFRNDIAHEGIYPFYNNLIKFDYNANRNSTAQTVTIASEEGQNTNNKEIINKEFNKMLKDVDLLSKIANELKTIMVNDIHWKNLFMYNDEIDS